MIGGFFCCATVLVLVCLNSFVVRVRVRAIGVRLHYQARSLWIQLQAVHSLWSRCKGANKDHFKDKRQNAHMNIWNQWNSLILNKNSDYVETFQCLRLRLLKKLSQIKKSERPRCLKLNLSTQATSHLLIWAFALYPLPNMEYVLCIPIESSDNWLCNAKLRQCLTLYQNITKNYLNNKSNFPLSGAYVLCSTKLI